jgi:hypothetical protein
MSGDDFAEWAAGQAEPDFDRWIAEAPTPIELGRRHALASRYLLQAAANLRALQDQRAAEVSPSVQAVEADYRRELAEAQADWLARVGHARACREWALAFIERTQAVQEAQRIVDGRE